jgi:hypothetical protein
LSFETRGPGERAQHPELLRPHLQRGGTHGAVVIGVQDQPGLVALADPLSDRSAADQSSGQMMVLADLNVSVHDLAAPHVHHQEEVQLHPPYAGVQVGDVAAPELVGPISSPPGHWPWPSRRSGLSAALHRLVSVEHAVEVVLGGQELSLVGQGRHELRRRHRGVQRHVADRQDLLALLLAQPMGYMPGAALAAVRTDPPPANCSLQGCRVHRLMACAPQPALSWHRRPRRHRGSPVPSGDQASRSALRGFSPEGLHLFCDQQQRRRFRQGLLLVTQFILEAIAPLLVLGAELLQLPLLSQG